MSRQENEEIKTTINQATPQQFSLLELLIWTVGFAVFFAFHAAIEGPLAGWLFGLVPITAMLIFSHFSKFLVRDFWNHFSLTSISVSWAILASIFGLYFLNDHHYTDVPSGLSDILVWGFTKILRYFQAWSIASLLGFLTGLMSKSKHTVERYFFYSTFPGLAAFLFFVAGYLVGPTGK